MSQSNDLSRVAVQRWEKANSRLASALESFLESSSHLEAVYIPDSGNSGSLISRIDSTLHSLERSRSLLSRTRNHTGSPLCRLPEELLIKIFLDVIFIPTEKERAAYPEMESVVRRIYQRLGALNRVCTAWRNVVATCKTAWRVVPIIDSEQKLGTQQLASNLSLQRADDALHLTVIRLRDWTLDELKILAEHAHRLSSANICVKSSVDLEDILKAFFEAKHPTILSELSVCQIPAKHDRSSAGYTFHHSNRYIFPKDSDSHSFFSRILEPLSVLRISGVLFRWDMITFPGRLTELHLHGVCLGYHSDLISFLRAASSAPGLQNLSIVSVLSYSTGTPQRTYPKFIFPKLRSLRLECLTFSVLRLVLGSISPGSHRLSIRPNKHSLFLSDGEELFQNSCRLLEGSHALLLNSRDWVYTPFNPHFRSVLNLTPHLKILKLAHWILEARVWDALTRPTSEDTSFPNLEERMIESHSIRKVVIGICVKRTGTAMDLSHLDKDRILAETLGADVVEWFMSAVPEVYLGITRVDPPEFRRHWWGLW